MRDGRVVATRVPPPRRRGDVASAVGEGVTAEIASGTIQPVSTQGITFREGRVTFNELIRLLEANGFSLVKQKGSIRHYRKAGWPRLIRVDYHGNKQVPTGTCHAILKAAGIRK